MVQVSQRHIAVPCAAGAEVLPTVGEEAFTIVQPQLVAGPIAIHHKCVEVAVAIHVRQRHGLAPVIVQVLPAVAKDPLDTALEATLVQQHLVGINACHESIEVTVTVQVLQSHVGMAGRGGAQDLPAVGEDAIAVVEPQ